jgi:hypothetical protein
MLTRPQLKMEVVWFDEDLVEIEFSVRSERFSGTANIYAGLTVFEELAALLNGFPKHPHDVQEFELGDEKLAGYGGVKIKFYCKDSLGHLAAHVTVFSHSLQTENLIERASIQIDLVPSSIDSFVSELMSGRIVTGSSVRLLAEA